MIAAFRSPTDLQCESESILNIFTGSQVQQHILLLYRVTINTTLAGLPSGFAFGLLIKFYASVLQQELI